MPESWHCVGVGLALSRDKEGTRRSGPTGSAWGHHVPGKDRGVQGQPGTPDSAVKQVGQDQYID